MNDPHENKTWVYEYDRGGNMTRRIQYPYTKGTLGTAASTNTYAYDGTWKDQITSNGSYPLTYDGSGNLKTYGGWVYEWEAGRQLVKQTQNEKVVAYDYDHNGMRIRQTVSNKTSGGVYATYNYTYNGSKLVHITVYSDDLHFFYDNQGKPAKVKYNGTVYSYLHNLQGDIVGILDNAGNLLVEYKYNAWGTLLSRTGSLAGSLGYRNPFRYRGYVFDEETGLYYLRSRYYNAQLQRFCSTDVFVGTLGKISGHNLYTYCRNDSVNMVDFSGNEPKLFYFYGKDQKQHARSNMKALKEDFETKGYLITCPEDFTEAWSDMYSVVGDNDIDIVIINLHGCPDYVENMDLDTLSFTKCIHTLVLLSCNAGHQSTGKENFAQKILKHPTTISLTLLLQMGLTKEELFGIHFEA